MSDSIKSGESVFESNLEVDQSLSYISEGNQIVRELNTLAKVEVRQPTDAESEGGGNQHTEGTNIFEKIGAGIGKAFSSIGAFFKDHTFGKLLVFIGPLAAIVAIIIFFPQIKNLFSKKGGERW